MKTIFKIAVGFVLMMAAFNACRAVLADYQFQDEVEQAMLFDPRATEEELTSTIMKIAAEYSVPLEENNIVIKMVGQDVRAEMTYTTSIMLIPGLVSKDWTFTPTASARILVGGRR